MQHCYHAGMQPLTWSCACVYVCACVRARVRLHDASPGSCTLCPSDGALVTRAVLCCTSAGANVASSQAVTDELGRRWELLCTGYSCQYGLSRIGGSGGCAFVGQAGGCARACTCLLLCGACKVHRQGVAGDCYCHCLAKA